MFFPLGHDTRIQRFPYVTVGLIALNTLIFIISQFIIAGEKKDITNRIEEIIPRIMQLDPNREEREGLEALTDDPHYEQLKKDPDFQQRLDAMKPELTAEEQQELESLEEELKHLGDSMYFQRWGFVPAKWSVITMITSAFLHGGWFHLIGNMLFLWIFGTGLEDKWGPWVYSGFYLLGAVAASTMYGLMSLGSDVPMVGASGAIFACCGAFMYRFYKTKVIMGWVLWVFFYVRWGRFNVPAWAVMILYFIDNFFSMMVFKDEIGGGVAYAAHVGGFLFGLGSAVLISGMKIEDKYLKPRYDIDGPEYVIPEEFQTALEQIGRAELDQALINLQTTLAKEPGYIPALTEIFKIHLVRKDRQAAVDMGGQVVDGFLKLGESSHAIDNYFKLVKDYPDASLKPPIQLRIADALMKSNQYREAAIAQRNLAAANAGTVIAQKALLSCGNLLTDKLGEHQNAMNVFKYLAKTYPQSDFVEYAKQGFMKAQQALKAQTAQAAGIPVEPDTGGNPT